MKKIVVILTACLLMLGMTVSIAAQSTSKAGTVNYDDLNYSEQMNKATIQMGDVLAQIPGFTVSEAEKNYIQHKFSGQNVLYYKKPVVQDLECVYDGETQQLTVVLAYDYQYLQSMDKEVLWIPAKVSVGTSIANFSPAQDNYYRATLENVTWSKNLTLTVEYAADFTITADTLNDFINFAYDGTLQLDREYVAFDAEWTVYQAAKLAYDTYRKDMDTYNTDCVKYELYLNSVALYNDYLVYQDHLEDVRDYQIAHDAYLANSSEWAKYEQDKLKYQEYINYKNGLYPGLCQEYELNMAKVQHHLYLLSMLTVQDPNTGISFVEMMVDDRIGDMIESKREQVEFAVGEGTTKNVIDSTRALQSFCRTYQTLTGEQEIYAFYIREYAGFVKNLNLLYDNIQKLYKNDTIYRTLQKEYPNHITSLVRMLGSLYVQKCVFDDTVKLDLTTVVDSRGNQTAADLVHPSVCPADNPKIKAASLSAWPTVPRDPESYEIKTMPSEPLVRLEDAVYPPMPGFSYVNNAQEIPEHMDDPGYMEEPVPPLEVPYPGPAPVLDWDPSEQDLYDAYLEGLIVQRPEFTQSQVVTLNASTKQSISLDTGEGYYYVYFYNTDDQGTYLGHSLGVRFGEQASIPEHLQTATKPPETATAYEFVEWVDRDGNPLDLSCLTEDVNAYASYRAVPRKYNVTWQAGDHDVVEQWEYGTTPVFSGSTDKSPSAQYTYAFIGWDKQFVPVTGDVTYTALYENTERRYQVTFDIGDGTIVTKEFTYGWNLSDVVATLKKPYRAPDAQYTYTFKGWRQDAHEEILTDHTQFPLLTGNMTFTAQFENTANSYTVTWIVDGEIVQTSCEYGRVPMFGATPDEVPFKEPEERFCYVFEGWDRELVPVTGDVTYIASFSSQTRYYRVDFVIEGEVYTIELEYEQLPVFDKTPQKASDVQYHYSFIGWDSEPVPVREDAVYTAEFGKVLRKYPVKFVVGGNEITTEFEYGATPVYPNNIPTKPDDSVYSYVFTRWDQPLAAVDGSAVTYTACFDAIALAPTPNGENGKLTIDKENGKYELKLEGTQVDLSLIWEKAGKEKAQLLQVFFGDAVLEFPKAQIEALYLMGDSLATATLARVEYEGNTAYRIELLDRAGNPIPYLVTELTVKLPYDGLHTADVFRTAEDGTLTKMQVEREEGYLVFSSTEFSTFMLKDKFLISQNINENGSLDMVGEAYEGEMITITPDPDEGYHVDEVVLEYNGQQIKLELVDGKYSFVMPRDNVRISAVFKVVEGGTVAEVIVGVVTALLIVAIGFVIAVVLRRRRFVKS